MYTEFLLPGKRVKSEFSGFSRFRNPDYYVCGT